MTANHLILAYIYYGKEIHQQIPLIFNPLLHILSCSDVYVLAVHSEGTVETRTLKFQSFELWSLR